MGSTLHNEKYRGQPEAALRHKLEILEDEIASNEEETRMMREDIEAIWEEIGRQAREAL